MHSFIIMIPYGGGGPPLLANKHSCIVDFSAMILLFNLSAFDSKPLDARQMKIIYED